MSRDYLGKGWEEDCIIQSPQLMQNPELQGYTVIWENAVKSPMTEAQWAGWREAWIHLKM